MSYSTASLFAYRGQPRVRQGTLIDGLPVAYKVPNFYVARTEAVRRIGYDDRLKRLDHNDFFTAAYGELVCVIDHRMVCLHAHSYFDGHYQSFRTDTAADSRLLSDKWGGDRGSLPEQGGQISDEDRIALHHAAVETVARELGIPLVHSSGPGETPVRVMIGEAICWQSWVRSAGWARADNSRIRSGAHCTWGRAQARRTRSRRLSPISMGWPPPTANGRMLSVGLRRRGQVKESAGGLPWASWKPRTAWLLRHSRPVLSSR